MRASSGSLSALKQKIPWRKANSISVLALAHAGEDAGAGVAAGGQHALQFSAADDVEAAAQIGQGAEDGQIGIGLHGEADAVVQRAEGGIQTGEMTGEGARE